MEGLFGILFLIERLLKKEKKIKEKIIKMCRNVLFSGFKFKQKKKELEKMTLAIENTGC